MSRTDIFAAINLGKELERINTGAHDIWSWLPSQKVAEKHHGEYYSEFQPSIPDVMTEACLYINKLKNRPNEPLNDEEKEWFQRCPCGEVHDD